MSGRAPYAVLGVAAVSMWIAIASAGPSDAAGPMAPPPVFESSEASAASRAETILVQASRVRVGRDRSISLTSEDLTALLRFGLPGVVPAGVLDPSVSIERGAVRISATFVHADFAAADELGALASVLPDTASVTVHGRISTVAAGWVDFRIERAVVGGIPVPEVVLAAVARRLPFGRTGSTALPRGPGSHDKPLLRVRRPHGVGLIYVAGQRLVVESAEPFGVRAVDEDSP